MKDSLKQLLETDFWNEWDTEATSHMKNDKWLLKCRPCESADHLKALCPTGVMYFAIQQLRKDIALVKKDIKSSSIPSTIPEPMVLRLTRKQYDEACKRGVLFSIDTIKDMEIIEDE